MGGVGTVGAVVGVGTGGAPGGAVGGAVVQWVRVGLVWVVYRGGSWSMQVNLFICAVSCVFIMVCCVNCMFLSVLF